LKSQKEFVAVTSIAIISIALVIAIYATLLATIPGGEVTVGLITGNVYYSLTNTTTPTDWETNLYNVTGDWFAKINFTAGTYEGPVIITWQLEKWNSGANTWSNVTDATIDTTITLTGLDQDVYASPAGNIEENTKWNTWTETYGSGSYRVVAYVQTQ